mmetsp:Transcript_63567/g.170182  ORF Transcript_63567/g.170182 Transcript_63567/m.170182 type:complete len:231 (-) Transcript_63567:252-944(-)
MTSKVRQGLYEPHWYLDTIGNSILHSSMQRNSAHGQLFALQSMLLGSHSELQRLGRVLPGSRRILGAVVKVIRCREHVPSRIFTSGKWAARPSGGWCFRWRSHSSHRCPDSFRIPGEHPVEQPVHRRLNKVPSTSNCRINDQICPSAGEQQQGACGQIVESLRNSENQSPAPSKNDTNNAVQNDTSLWRRQRQNLGLKQRLVQRIVSIRCGGCWRFWNIGLPPCNVAVDN